MKPNNINVLKEGDWNAWNSFVARHPHGTFFHLAEWRDVLQQAFQIETFYLYAHDSNVITGILPLALVRRPLLGKVMISTPFCVLGGVLSNNVAITKQLEDTAVEMAKQHKVKYLELRYNEQTRADWPVNLDYFNFCKNLYQSNEENFKAIPKRRRAEIRKALSINLTCEEDIDINRFFAIYSCSLRNQGTPVYPKRYFEVLRNIFKERMQILTVSKDGNSICSLLSFYFGKRVMPYYIGGLPLARSLRAYDFVLWQQMQYACDKGVEIFDLGRSIAGTGSYHSKKTWGIKPEPLVYQYYLIRAKNVPHINPLNPRYRPLVAIWKRLPLSIANSIGPLFSRIIA